ESYEADMPVLKYAEEYNMNHNRRGKAVIFNHDEFKNKSLRPGSAVDASILEETYKVLGFEVIIHNNLRVHQIQNAITGLAEEDHSDADCLLVTVLTHGESSKFLQAYDALYNVEDLWLPFTADKCLSLAGKPKVFIIQACRGKNLDRGVTLRAGQRRCTEIDAINAAYKIPTHADFLIVYSSVEGYPSWRDPDTGTWFIQCLCQELQEHASTKDFLKIVTRTSRRVAIDHESYNDTIPLQHQQKQIPSFNSMLIRDLYFRPKML
ncbi:hypothetical protein Cfor_07137, partial [Coptotermes formosanus]